MARAPIAASRIGLTDGEVANLRAELAGNRRPRVILPGNQLGADARGQVTAVGDPTANGADFISVRVKLHGVSDTLTFNPDELSLPGKQSGSAASSISAGSPQQPGGATIDRPRPQPPPSPNLPARQHAVVPASARAKRLSDRPSHQRSVVPAADEPTPDRRAVRRRSPASVTMTISSSGQSWTFAATRGTRSLVKQTPVPAGVVSAIADLLSDVALRDAVTDINDMALAQAEERAAELRKQLAAVESLLQSHRRPADRSAG